MSYKSSNCQLTALICTFLLLVGLLHLKSLSGKRQSDRQDSVHSTSHGKILSDREGVLELGYSHDTKSTHNGNTDPKGFGHFCISVPDVAATCRDLVDAGYNLQTPFQGDHAIVQDPDGYWVKLVELDSVKGQSPEGVAADHAFHSTMLRVKDGEKSVDFYKDVFGMTLHHTVNDSISGKSSYFLGYGSPAAVDAGKDAARENLLELCWSHGTENVDGRVYHDGNSEPEGFGHICISVDDTAAACERFESRGVTWQKRLNEGPFRIAFIYDPDGYVGTTLLADRSCRVLRLTC